MKIFNYKKIKNKNGSALLVVIMIFFAIFIIAFASAYLVFLDIYKTSDFSNNLRAYYAARSGLERARFEVIKNNYNFYDNCSDEMFSQELENSSTYFIKCVDNGGVSSFYSVGSYKNSQVSLEIDCINIMEDCNNSCLQGSLCGGGKLLDDNNFSFIVSPPSCNLLADSCDNDFLLNDTNVYFFENPNSNNFFGASSTDDGLFNISQLDPQNNINFLAAKYCDDLDINGFNDWYLPAISELEAIGTSTGFDYFNMSSAHAYWSSTESASSSSEAYYMSTEPLEILYTGKDSEYRIRCIRKYE